jgi:hypothetical protein
MSHATPETVTAPAIDKSTWGPGPWQSEPDRVDFVHAGFACFALRHPRYGCWCCYVGVPPEHPLYGLRWGEDPRFGELHIHMGVNYTEVCAGQICHVPAPGMPRDVWWIGTDMGHFRDLCPAMAAREAAMGFPVSELPEFLREVYRELPYVRRECERLAEQLAAMG